MDTHRTTDHCSVLIAGAGPTGLMLAAELTLAGIDVVVVERRPNQDLDGSRAGGLHARTLEVLDQRGVVERFVTAGQLHPFVGYAGTFLDITDFPSRHNHLLALWQRDIERIMADWVEELGVVIRYGCAVLDFVQRDSGVEVALSDGTSLQAEYLVGCDGGRSVIRKAAGIEFPGWDATSSFIIAEVEMTGEPQIGMRPEGGGIGPVDPALSGGPYRVALLEREHLDGDAPARGGDTGPDLQDLRDALVAACGTDYGVHSPSWISRFTDMCRQAATYRVGRVLLAGDAAHVHGPQGGQGLNTGVQDAVNLGWKLAQVVNGVSPERLLDTYHAERHPVGARVLRNTMAQVALSRTDERSLALRESTLELLAMDEPRRHIAGTISGLDIAYHHGGDGDGDGDGEEIDGGARHPLVGRRMPDLDLQTSDGRMRVFALLHDARPVLVDLQHTDTFDVSPWADRVRLVRASYDGRWELPVIGEVPPPPAVLIRPDGHVAWVGELTDPDLPPVVTTWFGRPDRELRRRSSASSPSAARPAI